MRRSLAVTLIVALATMSPLSSQVSFEGYSAVSSVIGTTVVAAQTDDLLAKDDQALAEYEQRAQAAGALGFWRDDAPLSLVVLVSKSQRPSFNLTDLGPAPVPVSVQYSDLDAAAILEATNRLLSFPEENPSAHGSLAFYFKPEIQKVEVITTFDPSVLFDYLGASGQLIDYQYGAPQPLTRAADAPPFWGGAKSHWAQDPIPSNYCTTSFTVRDSGGTRHLVEPAHCGPVGGTVKTWSGTYTVGTYGNKHCGNVVRLDNSDVQWISGQSYGSSIYVGDLTGSRADVVEAGTPAVGAAYWYSGARTAEKSNQVVLSTEASIWWDDANDWCNPGDGGGWWQLHLISFQRSGVCDTLPGDSGAPFYVRYAHTPYPQIGIRGMATAVDGNTCFGEKWPRISSLLGVSIATN